MAVRAREAGETGCAVFALEESAAEAKVRAAGDGGLRASSADELLQARVACQVLDLGYRDRLMEGRSEDIDEDADSVVYVAQQHVLFTEELLKRGVCSREGPEEDRFASLRQLLEALLFTGRTDDAEALFRKIRSFGALSTESAGDVLFLVAKDVFLAQGRYAEALELVEDLRCTALAYDEEVGASLMFFAGTCLAELHQADAVSLLEKSVERTRAIYGEEDPLYTHRREKALEYTEHLEIGGLGSPENKGSMVEKDMNVSSKMTMNSRLFDEGSPQPQSHRVAATPARPVARVSTPSPCAVLAAGETPSPLAAPSRRGSCVRRLDLKV